MEVYSIGREAGCDIVINDSTDVISRRHAVLTVQSSGKMTITDQSHNGTYVNGIRISPNVPVPVTRKDNISLAHVARLNWDMVPKTTSPLKYAIFGIIGLAVVGGGIFGYNQLTQDTTSPAAPAATDSTAVKKDSTNIKKEEPEQTITPKKTEGKKTSPNKNNKGGSKNNNGSKNKGGSKDNNGSENKGGSQKQEEKTTFR